MLSVDSTGVEARTRCSKAFRGYKSSGTSDLTSFLDLGAELGADEGRVGTSADS